MKFICTNFIFMPQLRIETTTCRARSGLSIELSRRLKMTNSMQSCVWEGRGLSLVESMVDRPSHKMFWINCIQIIPERGWEDREKRCRLCSCKMSNINILFHLHQKLSGISGFRKWTVSYKFKMHVSLVIEFLIAFTPTNACRYLCISWYESVALLLTTTRAGQKIPIQKR